MPEINLELARDGQREPLSGLVSAADFSIALAREPAVAKGLAAVGWGAEQTDRLEAEKGKLIGERAEQTEALDASRLAAQDKTTTLSNAKEAKRAIDAASGAMFSLNVGKELPVTPDAFEAGGKIGNSMTKMLGFFLKAQGPVAAAATLLKPLLGGQDPVALVAENIAALQAATTKRAQAFGSQPAATLELYEAKGTVLQLINQLNAVGRVAFLREIGTRVRFNKDLLLAARQKRAVKTPNA